MIGTLWLVEFANKHYLCNAFDREDAKTRAHRWFGYDQNKYIVTPLTQDGDCVRVEITLAA